jgi:DNA-binding transcriptional regulator LsrR (DeoR family)
MSEISHTADELRRLLEKSEAELAALKAKGEEYCEYHMDKGVPYSHTCNVRALAVSFKDLPYCGRCGKKVKVVG